MTISSIQTIIRALLGLAAGALAGIAAASPVSPLAPAPTAAAVRMHESFDQGWRFARDGAPGAEQPGFNDANWRRLDLPHDWSIEGPYDAGAPTGGPGGFLPTGVGWYRKHFKVPAGFKGRQVTIRFDGVYMDSTVWINGHELGRWPFGYSSFHYDLTPHLNYGDAPNVIAVRVDNSRQPNSRWYSGSGIYRHVWITATDPLRVADWGTYVTTPVVTAETATVRIRTRVKNDRAAAAPASLRSEIVGPDGQVVATVESEQAVPAGAEQAFDQSVVVLAPQRWSPETPALYTLRTTVKSGGETTDDYSTTFGIRDLIYDVDRGFLLNGKPTKMFGMCVHHDAGAVGAAVPEDVWERRLRLLKEMGCNAVRTSHNPMAPEFYDLCDRLGLLVMNEIFDEWTVRKPQIKFGYSDFFDEWHERDVVNFIRRDRNHPSVVMWSAGNEIGDQQAPQGTAVVRKLVALFHREDPTRPVTAGLDSVYDPTRGSAPVPFTEALDIAGYNYVDRFGTRRETYFEQDRRAFPARRFIGAEDTAVRGVRGDYEFRTLAPGTPLRAVYASGMIQTAELWKFALTHDYVIGHFMWVGIDYLGEAPWPRKNSVSGALDTCGFKKDGFYFYQSLFTAQPMLHLFPHWNWTGREGQVTPVVAYTNCSVVELFLNGRSLGAKAREFPREGTIRGHDRYAKPRVLPTTADVHLSWDVPFEPGVLKAVGYVDGKVACESEVRTASAAAAIELTVDRKSLEAGRRGVAHATVRVVDAAGVVVPDAAHEIAFIVEGAGALIGIDNGDPEDHDSYQASRRKAFRGLCLGLVRAGDRPGPLTIRAGALGLAGAEVRIEVVPSERRAPLFQPLP